MAYNAERVAVTIRAMQRYTVYGPRVVVLRDDPDTKVGSIHLAEEAQKRKSKGTIVKIGDGYAAAAEKENCEGITVGHRVTFNAYDGVSTTIPVGDRKIEVLAMHVGNLYMGWTQ